MTLRLPGRQNAQPLPIPAVTVDGPVIQKPKTQFKVERLTDATTDKAAAAVPHAPLIAVEMPVPLPRPVQESKIRPTVPVRLGPRQNETPKPIPRVGARWAVKTPTARRTGRRKLYIPNNAGLFNAALAGYMGGVNQARGSISTTDSDYASLVSEGILFAQAVDQAIPFDPALSFSEVCLAQDLVSNFMGLRYPEGLPQSAFTSTAAAIAAQYAEASPDLLPYTVPSTPYTPYWTDYYDDCTAGGTVFGQGWNPYPNQVTLTGAPGAPFIYEANVIGFNTVFTNQTSELCTVTNYNSVGAVTLPPGTSVLIYSDAVGVYGPGSLVDPIIVDGSSFVPAIPGAVAYVSTNSQSLANQTVGDATPFVVPFTGNTSGFPLPGTVAAPSTTGTLWIDVFISMTSTSTTDAAVFKFSWGWNVQTPGAPVAIGALVTALAVNTGGSSAAWSATLALDGTSEYGQVTITSDAALTVDIVTNAQWNYLQ